MVSPAAANGVLRDGFGAADSGAAGAFSAVKGDALSAMQVNPAALAAVEGNEWTLAAKGLWGDGDFERGGSSYDLDVLGGYPEFAMAWRPQGARWVLGVSVAPLSAQKAEWFYPDAPGGIGGISYGTLEHDSGFLALRTNVGLAWELDEHWSIGASVGALYSRVEFDAPFIFQTHPALAGAKVDLDLETDGWEPVSEFGILWRPDERWSVGLKARPQVTLDLDGSAAADFSAQLPPLGMAGTPPFAGYDAATANALPWVVGGGLSWRANEKLKLGFSAEWIGWSSAFDDLEVRLTGGTNGAINGAIGSGVWDRVPVGWKNTWVLALGAEYEVSRSWTLRAGWRWGASPAPEHLVTPLNASILEHTLAFGAGWRSGCWSVDISYQLMFGSTADVGVSGYRAGEYSNSSVEVGSQALGLGVTRRF